jgi:hypothetical protein
MVLPFYLFTFLPLSLSAQTFTQRLQKRSLGEGTVTVTHSQEIDQLVNGTKDNSTTTTATPAKTPTTAEAAKTATAKTTKRGAGRDTVSHVTYPRDTTEPVDTATHKKVMRGGYKVNGYRVQVFAGGNQRKDRQQATRVGNEIKSLFPSQPVYVHFYSPRWICRMGNFRTYEEAHQVLTSVRKMGYNAATIIKDKITVYNVSRERNIP